MAEDYHQKFALQMSALFSEITAIYPDMKDVVNSTAAARLNGYLGGFGDVETVKAQLDQLGLSEAGKTTLLELIESGLAPACPAPGISGYDPLSETESS
jgi:peptide-methionine (S)-S-oxide reductase